MQKVTLSFLRKRYGLNSNKEVSNFLKEHLEQINYDDAHIQTSKGEWHFDDEALLLIDAAIGYVEKAESAMPETDNDHTLKMMQHELESAKQQIDVLKEELQKANDIIRTDKMEHQKLQDEVVMARQQQDVVNTSLIQKNQLRAEKAEKEVERLTKRLASITESKDRQIAELKDRVAEHQQKLTDQIKLMEEKAKAEFDVLTAKKEVDRVYSKMHETEQLTDKLNLALSASTEEKEDALNKVANIQQEIVRALQQLTQVQTQLASCADISIEHSEVKADANINSETAHKQKKNLKTDSSPSPIKPTQAQVDIMEKLHQEQEAKVRAAANDTSWWNKVASFFG